MRTPAPLVLVVALKKKPSVAGSSACADAAGTMLTVIAEATKTIAHQFLSLIMSMN